MPWAGKFAGRAEWQPSCGCGQSHRHSELEQVTSSDIEPQFHVGRFAPSGVAIAELLVQIYTFQRNTLHLSMLHLSTAHLPSFNIAPFNIAPCTLLMHLSIAQLILFDILPSNVTPCTFQGGLVLLSVAYLAPCNVVPYYTISRHDLNSREWPHQRSIGD